METIIIFEAFACGLQHGSYLQGMETITGALLDVLYAKHGSYLQGMETHFLHLVYLLNFPHGSYLQGMETGMAFIEVGPETSMTRILPTRNGNFFGLWHCTLWNAHTDPTYKEWKPFWFNASCKRFSLHGSYLQGMETNFCNYDVTVGNDTDPTYKEWKPHMVANLYTKPLPHGSYLQGMETRRFVCMRYDP